MLGLETTEIGLTKEDGVVARFVVMVGIVMVDMVGVAMLVSWCFDTIIGFKENREIFERE